jgi:hypothetical protein
MVSSRSLWSQVIRVSHQLRAPDARLKTASPALFGRGVL